MTMSFKNYVQENTNIKNFFINFCEALNACRLKENLPVIDEKFTICLEQKKHYAHFSYGLKHYKQLINVVLSNHSDGLTVDKLFNYNLAQVTQNNFRTIAKQFLFDVIETARILNQFVQQYTLNNMDNVMPMQMAEIENINFMLARFNDLVKNFRESVNSINSDNCVDEFLYVKIMEHIAFFKSTDLVSLIDIRNAKNILSEDDHNLIFG